MACIWNLLENGIFFFSKNVGIFTFCSKMGKTGFYSLYKAYSVDHVELIEPQEAVVLMIFWHFKILRSIFSCNFGPF